MSDLPGQLQMLEVAEMEREAAEAAHAAFVDKFVPKLTTDDCYTPELVYEAVADWVAAEYGIRRADMLRPFWPGGDYQSAEYPDGCAVVDNPPFSILSQIVGWYCGRGIRFFLFAPALTLFAARNQDVSYLPCGVGVTYANGAEVPTSFVTNLDSCRIRVEPALYRAVEAANDRQLQDKKAPPLPKYIYPDNIVTAAICQRWAKYGISWRLEKADCVRVSGLDSQKAIGKSIFGGGYLLSERAAAERAAAERAAALRWQLSPREMAIVARLGGGAAGVPPRADADTLPLLRGYMTAEESC